MTYIYEYTHALVCVASVMAATVTDVNAQRFHEIANNCCPHEAVKCCADTIEQRQPLNCSLSFEDLLSASDCIQRSLFGSKSLEIVRIEDVECCRVFSEMKTEAFVFGCVEILRTPAIRSTAKLKLMKSSRPSSKYYQCFRKCQSFLRSRKIPTEKFPYLAVCDLVERLESGVLYIGPELKD